MRGPILLLLILPIAMLLQASCTLGNGGELHPVVLIPGSGGNQLEARLTAAYRPSTVLCRLWRRPGGDGWFRLWFDPTVLFGPLTRCFAERMTLRYDEGLDDYRNAKGVETRVPYFGSTEGLLYLDPGLKHLTEYMATLVNSLQEIGYRDGENLFGAPYDFRYGLAAAPHPSKVGTQYLKDLKQLIESASAANGGKPIILLSHSLGGLFALHLLTRNPVPWRQKFIKHLITLSAPWGGTVQAMLTVGSGYTLGIPIVDPLTVRGEQRSSESNLWLLPSPQTFGNRTLAVYNKNYSAFDIPDFLEDIGFREGVGPYRARVMPLMWRLEEPTGVSVTCVVGTSVETPETLLYGRGGFDVQPDVVYGDGDGTVNLLSLLRLESEWSGSGLKVVRVPGVSHTGILKDRGALAEIVREISSINSVHLSSAV